MESQTETLDALQQSTVASVSERNVQIIDTEPGVGAGVHRPIRKRRVTRVALKWRAMTTEERVAAILAAKAEGKTYRQIAAELGTNKEAVGGLLFRQGYTKPNERAHAAVANNAHPLIKELFAHADNRGVDSGSLVRRSGYSMETVYLLRTNPRGARLRTVADLGETVGLKLAWVPK